MDIATGLTVLGSLTIIAVAGFETYKRRLEHAEIGKKPPEVSSTELVRQHERQMADKGYIQIPVLARHTQEAEDNSDEHQAAERVSEERVFQLAWVHKDAAESVLLAAAPNVVGDVDLLEAALRPT